MLLRTHLEALYDTGIGDLAGRRSHYCLNSIMNVYTVANGQLVGLFTIPTSIQLLDHLNRYMKVQSQLNPTTDFSVFEIVLDGYSECFFRFNFRREVYLP